MESSSYLKYLPAIYSQDDFLGRFLLIFESIWKPLDLAIDNLHHYFDARMAPAEMLPWLASWLGLVLDERWPEARRRELIRSAVELYSWRGTRRGLAEMLKLYTGLEPVIEEPGVTGRKGRGAEDGAFIINFRVNVPQGQTVDRSMLEAIINLEKPAHTGYRLEVVGEGGNE